MAVHAALHHGIHSMSERAFAPALRGQTLCAHCIQGCILSYWTSKQSDAVQCISKVVSVTNNLSTTVEASIRAGSSDRYTVHPQQIKLKPGQSSEVEVRLKVTRFAQAEKAVTQGQRDSFHIKAPFFDQKFSAVFFLSPQHLPASHLQRRSKSATRASEVAQAELPTAKAASINPAEQHAGSTHSQPATPEKAVLPCSKPEQAKPFAFRLPDSPDPLPQRLGDAGGVVWLSAHGIALTWP